MTELYCAVPDASSTFDRIAAEYDETIPPHVTRHYLRKRVEFARRVWPAGGHIMDLGCGTGSLSEALTQARFRVTGIDRSLGMLEQAHRRRLAVACAGADALPWADHTFDGAISVAVMHHLATPSLVSDSIGEMVRVIKPGGHAVVWDHNPLNPYWPIFMRRLPQDDGSERLIGRRELRRAASRAGARVVRETGLGWVPDFVPERLLSVAGSIERAIEMLPGTGLLAAHNVFVLEKASSR